MPSVTLVTNVRLSQDETQSFILEFSKFCSEIIEKPESQFLIDFSYNPYLAVRGTFEPAVRMHAVSTQNTTPGSAQKWAEAFFRSFETRLGVPANRGHLMFTDPGDQFVGEVNSRLLRCEVFTFIVEQGGPEARSQPCEPSSNNWVIGLCGRCQEELGTEYRDVRPR